MKTTSILLGITQTIVALGAIPAGLFMIIEPDGSMVGMSAEILTGSPFSSFLIPGLFLFIINGLFQGIGSILSYAKNKYAGSLGVGLGILLMLWIVVQVYSIGLIHFLQPLFLAIGLIEFILGYRLAGLARS